VDIFLTIRYCHDPIADIQRIFDRSIITLKIALNRLATIIDEFDDSSIVYEILLDHKSVLHQQIELLIKEKKKVLIRYVR
jgi:ParB family transcriptional regulator, chromosome partitioning protein